MSKADKVELIDTDQSPDAPPDYDTATGYEVQPANNDGAYGGQPVNIGGQLAAYGGQTVNYEGQPAAYRGLPTVYGGPPAVYGGQPAYGMGQIGKAPMQLSSPVTQQPAEQITTVNLQPAAPTVIVQQVEKPPSYMWLSCLVYWCCNCICGGFAFAMSMSSDQAADSGDMEEAKKQGNNAMVVSIIGFFFGIISWVVFGIHMKKIMDGDYDTSDTYHTFG